MRIFGLLSLFSLLFSFSSSYAQFNQQIGFYYGHLGTDLVRSEELNGGASYESKSASVFGFRNTLYVYKQLRLDVSVSYSSMDVEITPEFMGSPVSSRIEKLDLISFPVLLHLEFSKYLFVNGGLLLDFQKTSNSFDSQSGLGYSLGFGAAYEVQQLYLFINPVFKKHAVFPFNPERFQQRLYEYGGLFGICYSF